MELLIRLPEFQLLIVAVGLLVFEAFVPSVSPKVIARLGMLAVALIGFGVCQGVMQPGLYYELYSVDGLALFFKGIFLVTLFFILWMSSEASDSLPLGRSEFMVLPMFTTCGMMLLASAVDFTVIFVALELVTISFYILVAYQRNMVSSLEAGAKYLVIGALSTGFLVYGIAFLYGCVGSTSLTDLAVTLAEDGPNTGLLFAAMLILVGLGFKIAAVPFHVWTPDVYQGAPTPVTAFLAVGSKAAGFVILMRVFAVDGFKNDSMVGAIASALAVLAALSIILGNFAALPQTNIKRLLGYSSISHAGFLLMGLSCMGFVGDSSVVREVTYHGFQAVLLYFIVYMLSTLLAFYVITKVTPMVGGTDLEHYVGLSQRSPLMAFALLVSFVSMAGIPPLAGFVGKLGIFAAVWESQQYCLLTIGVIGAAVGLYYYLGVVRSMYWREPKADAAALEIGEGSRLLVFTLSLAVIILGVWQVPLVKAVSGVLVTAGVTGN